MSGLMDCMLSCWRSGRLSALATVGLIVIVIAIFSPVAAATETTLERIHRKGEVRLGYAREVPFSFRATDGTLTGSGPEVVKRVFAEMGIDKIVGIESEFGALIRDLEARRFDVIAVGMFILPDRCRRVLFSEPYYRAGTGLAVRLGNPLHLNSFEDVANSPKTRLGVVAGAVEIEFARLSGVAEHQILIFPDTASAVEGIVAGRVDAFAAMAVTVQELVRRDLGHLERAVPFHNPDTNGVNALGHGGFAFRREDVDLRDAFNAHLSRLLQDPGYLDLIRPFGFTDEELPVRATKDLCADAAQRSQD